MNEMIERVGRAIFEADHPTSAPAVLAMAWAITPTWNPRTKYCAIARAAIEAMREPTDAMVKAGLLFPSEPIDGEFDSVIGNDLPVERYKEMIHAALA